MVRFALVVGLLLLCCGTAAARGLEVYELIGLSPGHVGGDAEAYGDSTAAAVGAELGGTWSADEKPRNGFVGAVGVRYPVTDLLGVAAEFGFAVRGEKWDITEAGGDEDARLTETLALNYWEIPLLLQVTPPVGGLVRPVFFAGPYLGLRAHASIGFDGYVKEKIDDLTKGSVVGGVLGAAAEFRTTEKAKLLLQARYTTVFGNAMEDAAGYEFKPHGLVLLLGVAYAL